MPKTIKGRMQKSIQLLEKEIYKLKANRELALNFHSNEAIIPHFETMDIDKQIELLQKMIDQIENDMQKL